MLIPIYCIHLSHLRLTYKLCVSRDFDVCVPRDPQNEYLGLVEQCMDFACELMDLCRGTQEVEAVLSEGGEENGSARDPLGRLKMAMEYEEKKVREGRGY